MSYAFFPILFCMYVHKFSKNDKPYYDAIRSAHTYNFYMHFIKFHNFM